MVRACWPIRNSHFSHCYLLPTIELLVQEIRTTYFYSRNLFFRQAFILACVTHISNSIMQAFFPLLFLIHFTLASCSKIIRPRAQKGDLLHPHEVFTSDDVTAENPGNQLTISGDTTDSTESGLKQQQQQQQQSLNSPEAPLLAGSANAHCNNGAESFLEKPFPPSRFRRSLFHHAKRQGTTFCTPEPQKLQGDEGIPIQPEKKGPIVGQVDSLPIVRIIIMRTKLWGSISQIPHEGVCGPIEVPICAPFPPEREYPTGQQSFSHVVVPVRFCKFFVLSFSPSNSTSLSAFETWGKKRKKKPPAEKRGLVAHWNYSLIESYRGA